MDEVHKVFGHFSMIFDEIFTAKNVNFYHFLPPKIAIFCGFLLKF